MQEEFPPLNETGKGVEGEKGCEQGKKSEGNMDAGKK